MKKKLIFNNNCCKHIKTVDTIRPMYTDSIPVRARRKVLYINYKDYYFDSLCNHITSSLSSGRYSVVVRVSYIPVESIEVLEGKSLMDYLNKNLDYVKRVFQSDWKTTDKQISLELDDSDKDAIFEKKGYFISILISSMVEHNTSNIGI